LTRQLCKTLGLWAVLFLLLLPGASLQAADTDSPRISAITTEGLYRIPESTLLRALQSAPGQPFSRYGLSEDVRRLYALGYFEDIRIYSAKTPEGGIALRIVVKEHPRVQAVEYEGNEEIDAEELGKVVTVAASRFLNLEQVEESKVAIRENYRDKGFYRAEAQHELVYLENNRVTVRFKINENAKTRIARIRVSGNRQVPESEIKEFMQLGESGPLSFLSGHMDTFKDDVFEMDVRRVQWVFLKHGFLDVKIGQPVVELSPDYGEMYLTVPVEEGPQYTVGRVDIVCPDGDGFLVDKGELLEKLRLKTGDTFNMENVQLDSQDLTTRYGDLGYAHANIGSRNNPNKEARIMDFLYVVEKGNPTYIRRIEVEGNETTRDKVIRREMKIAEGDLYNQSLIKKSEAYIYRLGYYKTATVESRTVEPGALAEPGTDQVDLIVRLEEQDTGTMQVGAGFSSLESFIFQGRVSKNNFLGRGQTLSVQAMLSSLRQIYMITFMEPYFFDTNWNFSFNLYNMETVYEAFETRATGGDVSWGYRFFDDYLVFLTYTLEDKYARIGGIEGFTPVPIERYQDSGITSSLRLSLSWDTRNNRLTPTEGFYHSISGEQASPRLGSESSFSRFILNNRWYVPLKWDLVLRLNSTLGYITSGDAKGIPIYERFYVGGIFSVRGFQRNSLSPNISTASSMDPFGALAAFPVGGTREAIFNAELEIPIVQAMRITAVLFLDAGNAYAESDSILDQGLRTSWGFGVRWWSQMGPLRFEWGFPFNPRKGEDPMVFEFTIGSAF
jgi:outer membrane protein insertion porin family